MEANIESDEPRKRIYRLLVTVHASCFTESTVMAVKITTLDRLDGRPLEQIGEIPSL